MNEVLSGSIFFGFAISLVGYQLGLLLKKKLNSAIFNPLVVAVVFVIAFMLLFRVEYEVYYQGAQYLQYFLTPATVCLAIPLYQQLSLLKKDAVAILVGIGCGVLASFVCIMLLSWAFGLSSQQFITLMPKSVTSPIGITISEEYGGIVPITVIATLLTGVLGNICAEGFCKLLCITEPVAKGVAIGASTHVVGTSKALEMGEVEGAMSSLSVVVTGLLTLIAAPFFVAIY